MHGPIRAASTLGLFLALLLPLSCGNSGGEGSDIYSLSGPLAGHLIVTGHSPADGAIQVPQDESITISFNAPINAESVQSEQIIVADDRGQPLLGSFAIATGNRQVLFQPAASLAQDSTYRVTVKKLVYDTGFRTLERDYTFSFRTTDPTPPTVQTTTPHPGQKGFDPQGTLQVEFSETMDPATLNGMTVTLRGPTSVLSCNLACHGRRLVVRPVADLPGNATCQFTIRGGAQGAKDISGNGLEQDLVVGFRTGLDTTPPELVSSIPPTGSDQLSPSTRICLVFDDSIDPAGADPAGIVLRDGAARICPTTITWSADGRRALLTPSADLDPDQNYVLMIPSGPDSLLNRSGVRMASGRALIFQVQAENCLPRVTGTIPADDSVRVAVNAVLEVAFSEALYPPLVTDQLFYLERMGTRVPGSVSLSGDGRTITLTPADRLEAGTAYRLVVKGGDFGLSTVHFRRLEGDQYVDFTTTADSQVPRVDLFPADLTSQVPVSSRFTALFSEPIDPESVTSDTVRLVKGSTGEPLAGTLVVERDGRVVRFTPENPLPASTDLRFTVLAGPYGVRDGDGNWLQAAGNSRVSVGFHSDTTAPVLSLTVNSISPNRNQGLHLPPFGFTIDLEGFDPSDGAVDPTSLVVEIDGEGSFYPSANQVFSTVRVIDQDTLRCTVTPSGLCDLGAVDIRASLADLSGNRSATAALSARVVPLTAGARPLERNQVVYLDFTTDREYNGRGDGKADWLQDLEDYGLQSPSDPIGRNATMRELVEEAIVAKINELYGRGPTGSWQEEAVSIRFVRDRPPRNIPFMHMAVGGQDPEGGKRSLGQNSTGILGRAWYDRCNRNVSDNNTGTSPGLGVFPGELFLYQANLHQQLYPGYLTTFGATFRLVSPLLGGTPAGEGSLDATVMDPGFDFDRAPTGERSRYLTIFNAADDLALAVATLLAHEVGHSLGLVAPGVNPTGLHGDSTMHCHPALFGQIMNAVVGYDGLVEEIYAFRPINRAYLQERILLK